MIKIETKDLLRAEQFLQHIPGGAVNAAASALNRSIEAGVTMASIKAREEYFILHRSIKASVKINRARADKLIASAISRGPRRELIDFRVSPPTAKRVPMVRVAVRKSGGIKDLPGAFVGIGQSTGMLHVLKRTGRNRYPLHIKYGPSVPEMIGGQKVKPFVEERAKEVFLQRLDHEIGRVLAQEAKK